jgi:hypothetical protein
MGRGSNGNIKRVAFEVDEDPGLRNFILHINDTPLTFFAGRAEAQLLSGQSFELSGAIVGEPGSGFAVRLISDGVSMVAIDRAEIPVNGRLIIRRTFWLD